MPGLLFGVFGDSARVHWEQLQGFGQCSLQSLWIEWHWYVPRVDALVEIVVSKWPLLLKIMAGEGCSYRVRSEICIW